MAGETRQAVFAQPEWLRGVPTNRQLPPDARVVFTGCGTSFHAAQTGGVAIQALEAAVSPPSADIMVCVSHEGETALTIEAERWFGGDVWLVTGKSMSTLAETADEVIVCTPDVERSWCHTASYTCAVAAIAALNGDDIGWLPDAVEEALRLEVEVPAQDKILVAGAGRDWPTAQEAVLKCAKAPTSRRRRITWSNCCMGIWRRSTIRRVRSCSKGRGESPNVLRMP